MKNAMEVTLPADLMLSHVVRQLAVGFFQWAGFGAKACRQWELVADELFMNAVKYGSEKRGTVRMRLDKNETGGALEIEDEGKGPSPLTAKELEEKIRFNQNNASLESFSGRGLALIAAKWMNRLQVLPGSKGGLVVRVEKEQSHDEEKMPTEIHFIPAPPEGSKRTVLKLGENVTHPQTELWAKPIQKAADGLRTGEVLELDFSSLDYVNSVFIGYLADWHNQAREKNGYLRLSHLSQRIKETMKVVGLDKIFELNL